MARGTTGSGVESTPEIANSHRNTFFDTYKRWDVYPVESDIVPFGGNFASAEITRLSVRDVVRTFNERNYSSRFTTWIGYTTNLLQRTAGVRTGSELNGLGRLSWYNRIMQDPLQGAVEAEEFTKSLHIALCTGRMGFCRALKMVGGKLDMDETFFKAPNMLDKISHQEALDKIEKALADARLLHGQAVAPLSKEELSFFSKYAHRILTTDASVGHTVSNRGTARQLVLAMQKMDRAAMTQGLMELSILMDPEIIRALDKMEETQDADSTNALSLEGVQGSLVAIIETQAGLIVVGGRDNNVYELEKMKNVCCLIDLGGNDTYVEGMCDLSRPILAILDLHGDDHYRGSLPGIQGSSFMGISILVDAQGNDVYDAKHHAQAATIGGACALVDYDGNDTYRGVRRVQGVALVGVALLVDRRGNDSYHAAMWSQGTGQTLGCGVLEDCCGNDTYYTGGMYYDSYPETPGYEGWGQGLGTGIRGVAAGGLGVLLEGEGDDKYEFDYIAHGGGYWMGLGFFRDFDGNDVHQGSTSAMWDGSRRRESKFQRFSTGFGCHYAAGFFFEDSGNDFYWASIMSQGFAWDCGIAFMYDFGGDDIVTGAGSGNQGQGAQAGLGVYVDFAGDDQYKGSSQGYASSNITYHDMPGCGGNFSFLLDYGGEDVYGCRAKNNTITRRGVGGFIIDRPAAKEATKETVAP